MRMRERLYRRQKHCRWCGATFDKPPWKTGDCYPTLDHIKPLSRGGRNIRGNLTLACARCNSLRGAAEGRP
jgi:5-methylcytosine-specific restriction endonuclease McrA